MKLFVGGLAWATDDASMRAAFQPFGNLSDAVVIKDRETGRSRGFGFVTYSDDASGKAALQAMNGASLDGRSIRCDEAVERERGAGGPPPPPHGWRSSRSTGRVRGWWRWILGWRWRWWVLGRRRRWLQWSAQRSPA